MKKNREYGIDFIKTIGIVLVLLVHGLGSGQLIGQPLNSFSAISALGMRIVSMISIPLFFICMGYLNHKYEFSKNYLYRLKPILFSYFLAVLLSLMSSYFIGKKELTLGLILSEFLHLNVSNYAWYARMYVLFFLLIPFLNRWFMGLKNKNEEKILLIVLIVITSLPALLNPFLISLNIAISLPAYFVQLYPIMYYFIGLFIYRNDISVKKRILTVLSLMTIAVQLLIFVIRYSNNTPNIGMFGSYGSFVNVLLATSVFLLLKNVSFKSSHVRKFIVYISIHTFDLYLISHIFDRIIYPIYTQRIVTSNNRLMLLIFPLIFTFICSLIYVFIKDNVSKYFKTKDRRVDVKV